MSERPCLHCTITMTIESFMARHGRRDPASGKRVVDIEEALAKIAEVQADLILSLAGRPRRRTATKFAHDALEAAIQAAKENRAVPVVIDPSGSEH